MGVRQFVGRARDGMQRGRVLGRRNSSGELQQRQIGVGVGRLVVVSVRVPRLLKRFF